MNFNTQTLILASTSQTRKSILMAAGLNFEARSPLFDEKAFQENNTHLPPATLALSLATQKALSLSNSGSMDYVIGADQVLDFNGKAMHKASDLAEATQNLQRLSGKIHKLHSAIVVAKSGAVMFSHVATAQLQMRNFSAAFLASYTASQPAAMMGSVGGYFYEGAGIHLFERVDGDLYTILGLPLLPLLAFLRKEAIVLT